MPELFYTLADVEKHLSIKKETLVNWIHLKKVHGFKISGSWHVSERTFHKLSHEQARRIALKQLNGPKCKECGKLAGFNKDKVPKTYCSKACSNIAFAKEGGRFAKANSLKKKGKV